MEFRRAVREDAWGLMRLYQRGCADPSDPVLLGVRCLEAILDSQEELWLVGERGSDLVFGLCLRVDPANRLAKIFRLLVEPTWEGAASGLREAIPQLERYLAGRVDVVYATTRTLSLEQHQTSLQLGFALLGIFPNARGADRSLLNGLSALYLHDALARRRPLARGLHPLVRGIFEICREQCGLPDEREARVERHWVAEQGIPGLELLEAPGFVAGRYERLASRHQIPMRFYPFLVPNALVTDAMQRIELFVRLLPGEKFAAILADRIELGVSPVELYDEVSRLLYSRGAGYVEVISDAADVEGIDAFAEAGFLPTAYFPAMRLHGSERRDYVILSRAFERPPSGKSLQQSAHPAYLRYYAEYLRACLAGY